MRVSRPTKRDDDVETPNNAMKVCQESGREREGYSCPHIISIRLSALLIAVRNDNHDHARKRILSLTDYSGDVLSTWVDRYRIWTVFG